MCCLLGPELTRLLFPLSELNFPALACLKWKTLRNNEKVKYQQLITTIPTDRIYYTKIIRAYFSIPVDETPIYK